jgi:hypothetical protein
MNGAPRVTGHLIGADRRNGLGMTRPYVYRGNQPDKPEDAAAVAARSAAARRASAAARNGTEPAHGTMAAYRQHRKHGEQPCPACCQAKAAASRGYRHAARARGAAWRRDVPRTCTCDWRWNEATGGYRRRRAAATCPWHTREPS